MDVLSSAEGDLMITGPALCLYFAALRCTTNPPSVPLPRRRKDSNGTSTASTPTDLHGKLSTSLSLVFFSMGEALTPEHQHDLARIMCGLDPLTITLSEDVYGIAVDLRVVAIEISQRRSFQDRYASDLQAALDSSVGASPGSGDGGGVPSASSSRSTNNSDALPLPPLPPKSDRPSSSAPGYIDEEEGGYCQGQGYYKPNNPTTNNNTSTTQPLKLQKSGRFIDSRFSWRVVEVRSA
ncbi:hypothetical protein K435DRAFT_808488 [Dendrothele bispora CBS 962.96]|uniref:Uncharacterized protein n=1 Tax=Dendrothele bispora (strain CBS 962.96) TaxID=1314807 RepID=A0A4S8L1A9_DENBC|nr:hypothetical protein K435DRAFT_808488 [Dendrothele bispora CBS 962.96]